MSSFDEALAQRMSSLGVVPVRVGESKFAAEEEQAESASRRRRSGSGRWQDKVGSVEECLTDERARQAFEDFARSCFSGESLECLTAIELWEAKDYFNLDATMKKLNPGPPKHFPLIPRGSGVPDIERLKVNSARGIFETFFLAEAPRWCCIEHQHYLELHASLGSNTVSDNIFNAAKNEVLWAIASSLFPRFQRKVEEDQAKRSAALTEARGELSDKGRNLFAQSLSMGETIDSAGVPPSAGDEAAPESAVASLASAVSYEEFQYESQGENAAQIKTHHSTGGRHRNHHHHHHHHSSNPPKVILHHVSSENNHAVRPSSLLRRLFPGKGSQEDSQTSHSAASSSPSLDPSSVLYATYGSDVGDVGFAATSDGRYETRDFFAPSPRAGDEPVSAPAAARPRSRKSKRLPFV